MSALKLALRKMRIPHKAQEENKMNTDTMELSQDELDMVNGGDRNVEKEVSLGASSVTICAIYGGGAGMLAGGPVGAAIGAAAGAAVGGIMYGVYYLLTDD